MRSELFIEAKNICDNIQKNDFLKHQLAEIKHMADSMENIPFLSYSAFKEFYLTGNRQVYERVYFRRRKLLNALFILTVVYEDDETYIKRLEDIIWAVMDEFTWALPAHVAHIKNDKAVNKYTEFIDLFSAETGFALAEMLNILGNRLDLRVKNRIKYEIRRRIIDPYLNGEEFSWEKMKNNWAAVCGGSVGAVFLYLADDEEIKKILPRIKRTLNYYFEGFKDDGVCVEGMGYWTYGFGYFTYFASLLYQYTDGKENLFDNKKIKEIAMFPQRVMLKNNKVVTFSDCSEEYTYQYGLSCFIADKFENVTVPSVDCAADFEKSEGSSFAAFVRDFAWGRAVCVKNEKNENEYFYFKDTEWYIKKTPIYEFAAKAGNNGESHNHNDVACFMFNVCGESVIADVGREEYTKKYFSSERYKCFAPSALAHSVPIINNELQKEGKEHKGRIVDADDKKLIIDFEKCYDVPELKGLRRSFEFGTNEFKMTDSFVFAEQPRGVCEHFVSAVRPEQTGNSIILGDVFMQFDMDCYECDISCKTFSTGYMGDKTVYLINLVAKNPCSDMKTEFYFTTDVKCKI